MNRIRIRGPSAQFEQLLGVDGLDFDNASAADDGAEHLVTVYATDDAVTAIRALGLTVDVLATSAELDQAFLDALEQPPSATIDDGFG
jgi:hypothetical protein